MGDKSEELQTTQRFSVYESHYITAHHLRVEAGHAPEGMDFPIASHCCSA